MTAAPTGRNVVLVVADSVRGDIFEEEAKNYAQMSAGGLHFSRAIAPAAWTLPSHLSMFTGCTPTEHGAIASGRSKSDLRKTVTSIVDGFVRRGELLAPHLQRRGIRTFSSTPNPWLGPLTGLHRGFDEHHFFGFLDDERSTKKPRRAAGDPSGRARQVSGVARASWRHARWIARGSDKGATRVLDRVTTFVSRTDQPFFAFVNLIEAHEPHVHATTERRWTESRHLKAIANAVLQPGPVRAQRVRHHNWGGRAIPKRLLDLWQEAYRSEIRYLDAWLVRLANMLQESGVSERTTIIVTSDHGENFGEKGIIGHGVSLEESTARVPLAIWGGDIPHAVVDQPASLVAVRATVEDLMLGTGDVDSLVRPGSWGSASIEVEDPAHVNRPPRSAARTARGPGAAFYDGNLKYVVDPFEGEGLYDLGADPTGTRLASPGTTPTEGQERARREWESRVSRATS